MGGNTDNFLTVETAGSASLRVRGSRFLGWIQSASSEEEVAAHVATVAGEHPDATHVVHAYRLRATPFRAYADDAGEPSGSAGKPILSFLAGENLENVVGIVVRYYGGTNLGIGGLTRAYRETITRSLTEATIVEEFPKTDLSVTVSYADSGAVESILASSEVAIDARYEERVHFAITLPEADVPALRDRVLSATSGRAKIS